MNTVTSIAIQTLYEHALRMAEAHSYALECIEWDGLALIRTHARGTCVEIGTRHGISTLALLAGADHVFSIDIDKTCAELFPEDWPWTFICEDGAAASRGWTKPVDVLVIDGNHTYNSVKAELDGWYPHLRAGADIFLHDAYAGNGIRQAIAEFCLPRGLTVEYHAILGHIKLRKQDTNVRF